jgi:hypothetical protein
MTKIYYTYVSHEGIMDKLSRKKSGGFRGHRCGMCGSAG